jgi:uncharacterized lipoprotein
MFHQEFVRMISKNIFSARMKSQRLLAIMMTMVVMGSAGCGWLKSRDDYKNAESVKTIEVPPDFDSPNSASAISVPDVAGELTDEDLSKPLEMGSTGLATGGTQAIETLTLTDAPESAFKRVLLALERGKIAEIDNQNSEAGTITLTRLVVDNTDRGFFKRMFGRATTRMLTRVVKIRPATTGSEVVIEDTNAQPANDAFAQKILSTLNQRLGQ